MKKLLLIFLLIAFKVSAQTPFPLFVPTNPDSIKTVVNVNGAPRTVYNIDLVRYRAALIAKDTAAALRLLISGNTSAIATNTGNISTNTTAIGLKADKSATISINGNSQTLGSNPNFTVSGGGGSTGNVTKDVTTFGAKGDGKYLTGLSTTAGSPIMTAVGGTFTSADVGKYIEIGSAGAANKRLITTIASVQSPTSITLATNALVTISGREGKYGTDNTDAFQNAIYSLLSDSTFNGKITVPYTGYPYLFTKPVTTLSREGDTVNNAQIYIPSSGGWGSHVKYFGAIEFEGEVSPNFYTDPLTRTTAVPQRMVILQSTLDSGALFGNAFTNIGEVGCGVAGGTRINYTLLKIKNIAARVNSKNGSLQLSAATTAFDFSNMSMLEMSNILADVESTSATQALPDTLNQYGIKTMSTCNWAHQIIENVVVRGYGNAFTLSEHAVVRNVYVASCYNGIVVQPMIHAAQITKALVQWSKNNIKLIGTARFNISNLDLENSGSAGTAAWQRNDLDLYEPVTTNSTGAIVFHKVEYPLTSTILKTSTTVSSGILINKLGEAGTALAGNGYPLEYLGNTSGAYNIHIKNSSTVSSANAGIRVENSAGDAYFYKYSTGTTGSVSDLMVLNNNAGDIRLKNQATGKGIRFETASNSTGVQLASSGNLLVNTATDNSTLTVNGSLATGFRFGNSATTLTATDYVYEANTNSFTVTLPTVVGATGRIYTIVNKTPSATITVATTSSQLINANTTYNIIGRGSVTVQSTGAAWMIVGVDASVNTSGTAATAGTATLASGTATVTTSAILAGSVLQFSYQNCNNCGTAYKGTVTAGTSFIINSTNAADASTVAWKIIY